MDQTVIPIHSLESEKEILLSQFTESEIAFFKTILDQTNSLDSTDGTVIEVTTEVGTNG